MNDALIQIWIITAKDGTINYAHCLGCEASLAGSCSHIASVLFYLEAWTKVNERLSCAQIKCPWIIPSFANKVEYSHVCDISFKSAKKMKADKSIENLNEGLQVSENSEVFTESPVQKPEAPAPTQAEMENFYFDLSKCKTKLLLLSFVPTADSTSKEMSMTFSPGSSNFCFLNSISSRSCLSRSPATLFYSRPLALWSRLVTGGPSSSCEMIILRSNSHCGIIRVCMGILTTALRNKKIRQILN